MGRQLEFVPFSKIQSDKHTYHLQILASASDGRAQLGSRNDIFLCSIAPFAVVNGLADLTEDILHIDAQVGAIVAGRNGGPYGGVSF